MQAHFLKMLRPLVLAMPLLAGGAGAAPLDNTVAFDGVYIPALALTSAAQTEEAAKERAHAAMRRLEARWLQLRPGLQQELGGPAAGRTLAKVDGHLAAARRALANQSFAHAHEALEEVRVELLKARQKKNIDYFVDRLTQFHEPMEALVLDGTRLKPQELTAAKRDAMEKTFVEARVLWEGIEQNRPDPRVYALSPARAAQLDKALLDERAALSRLSDALRAPDAAALLKAAAALKPAFARAFTAFGQTD